MITQRPRLTLKCMIINISLITLKTRQMCQNMNHDQDYANKNTAKSSDAENKQIKNIK